MIELLEKYGGWPVIEGESWNSKPWSWLNAYKSMAMDGMSDTFILDVSIAVDPTNAAKRVLQVNISILIFNNIFIVISLKFRSLFFRWMELHLD